jgi:hypothetical protein
MSGDYPPRDHDILIRLDTKVEAIEKRLIHVENLSRDLSKKANMGIGGLSVLLGLGGVAGWLIHFVVDKLFK